MKVHEIVSYNLNGIRAAVRKGLVDWVKEGSREVYCFQETKAHPEDVPTELFEELGYKKYIHSAEKKGYSGVAVFTKVEPDYVEYGCGIERYDREGRVIRLDFGDVTLINTYFPSGTSGDERQAFKMEFLEDYFHYIQDLRKSRKKLVVCGDYNICHQAIDIHDPVRNKKNSGFLPEEREWMTQFFDTGMIDTFRQLNPDALHRYSWWSQRANARANNKGWRIDYISVSESLKEQLAVADIWPDVIHSDHCPVYLSFK